MANTLFCLSPLIMLKEQITLTKFYNFWEPEDTFSLPPPLKTPTNLGVFNYDCLDVGLHMKTHLGLNPVVLNMCSPNLPGGGFRTGAGAQEESLFRRTNYYQVLGDPDELLPTDTREWGYPLPEFCGTTRLRFLVTVDNFLRNLLSQSPCIQRIRG